MQHTNIEWVINPDGSRGYTSNPVKGKCLHGCPYCYAEQIRKHYKWPEKMSYHIEELDEIEKLKKRSTIFVGSMHDIFGEWVPQVVIDNIAMLANYCPHTLLFLTKNPTRYLTVIDGYLHKSMWLGVTMTYDNSKLQGEIRDLYHFYQSQVNVYVSFEPLLGEIGHLPLCDWAIIGCLNRNGRPVSPDRGGTKKEWVLNLIEALDNAQVPIFIKDALYRLYPDLPQRRELSYLRKK